MLEKIVERFCDSPTQYRYLLQTEKTVEKRALEGKNDLSNMSLAITCVFGFIWGVFGVFYVLPGFMSLLYYVLLYPKPRSGLPLSGEFIQKQIASESWIPFLGSLLVVVVFVGGQFVAYLLNIWIYFGVYCVMVIGGFIGFVYYFRKNDGKNEKGK